MSHSSLSSQFSFAFDSLFVRDVCGRIQPASAAQILEAARQVIEQQLQRGVTCSALQAVRGFLSTKLAGLPHEVFAVLFLDNQHRLIEYVELFRGTIDAAAVYPREVVKETLSRNAAAVIFAHNHPSGSVEASQADRMLTDRLKQALALVDVRVLDHIIVAGNATVSFAERGWL